ncbi:hypothetical protein FOZ63_032724, partial [Perkinsus olseni]
MSKRPRVTLLDFFGDKQSNADEQTPINQCTEGEGDGSTPANDQAGARQLPNAQPEHASQGLELDGSSEDMENMPDVDNMIPKKVKLCPEANKTEVERNRKRVKNAIDIVLLCARQGIALRGHNECASSANRGNFLEIFHLLAKHCPDFRMNLETLSTSKYTSGTVQNTLLHLCAEEVRGKIRLGIESEGYYSLIADECRDASKKEQLTVTIRYLKSDAEGCIITESVLDMRACQQLTAEAITEDLVSCLRRNGLDLDRCIGLAFDGASSFSGRRKGCQALLRQQYTPRAVYQHCYAHK